MDFKKRILYYGFGFVVGAILVFFIWSKKEASFDYLPQARVLKDIKSKPINIGTEAKRTFADFQIDTTHIKILLKDAMVDFSKSDTKTNPCKTYWLTANYNSQKIALIIENCDSVATIQRIEIE